MHLNREIQRRVRDYKKERWLHHVASLDHRNVSSSLWSTVRALTSPKPPQGLHSIKFPGNLNVCNSKQIACKFNELFHPKPLSDKSIRATRRKLCNIKFSNDDITPFTNEEVARAIRDSKASRAIGPDGINMLMLKNLGPIAIDYITYLFNLSLQVCDVPYIWKMARVIPILKPLKDISESNSYRPISLLSPVGKVLKKLLLPIF